MDFGDEFLEQEGARMFRSLIGGLLYIANQTRMDVSFPVNFLSRFMQRPTALHWKYALKVLNYLYYTRKRKAYLGRIGNTGLEARGSGKDHWRFRGDAALGFQNRGEC
ncbi:hypothetical protein TYRP_018532 [Tyrophagus putrescentiae]|nr:hypothetical protein TYRP_018532 [Tyrophagus putrescentiae]